MDAGHPKEEGYREEYLWQDTRDHHAGCVAGPGKSYFSKGTGVLLLDARLKKGVILQVIKVAAAAAPQTMACTFWKNRRPSTYSEYWNPNSVDI